VPGGGQRVEALERGVFPYRSSLSYSSLVTRKKLGSAGAGLGLQIAGGQTEIGFRLSAGARGSRSRTLFAVAFLFRVTIREYEADEGGE
jgi:hypothetical protein